MKLKRIIYSFLTCLIVLSFLFTAFPSQAQDMSDSMGCCQFEGEKPGCWYPSDADSCTNLEGKYLKESKNCSMETGYCEGFKKDGESKKK